jgi:hypothetical protein
MWRTFGTRIVSGARFYRPRFGLVFAKTGTQRIPDPDHTREVPSNLAANLLKKGRNWVLLKLGSCGRNYQPLLRKHEM